MAQTAKAPRLLALALCVMAPLSVNAQCLPCPDPRIAVEGGGSDQGTICSAATRAVSQLESCGLALPDQVVIEIVDDLPPACLGVYHRGALRIEMRAPEDFARQREGQDSLFSVISDAAFYESTLRHELAHATLDTMPCPIASCLIGQEYIAYSLQIRFLPEPDRLAFEAARPLDRPVPRDMLNPMILFMAPDTFARFAAAHLAQQDDPCAFIGQIARGEVLLDHERP